MIAKMLTLTEKIKAIDMGGVIEGAGVELRTSGTRRVGKCPFHDETQGSFFVFPDNKFHCFSCRAHGDPVDFIQQLKGYDFKQALAHLGIRDSQSRTEIRRAVAESRRRIREKKIRVQRERDLLHTLAILIRSTHKVMASWKSIDDLERSGDILQPLSWWEHCHDILSRGDQDQKNMVVDALKDMITISRAYLWTGKFNYREWLRKFLNGENHGTKQDPKRNSKAEQRMGGC